MADGLIKKIAITAGLLLVIATSSGCVLIRYPVYENVFGYGIYSDSPDRDSRLDDYQKECGSFQK